MAWGEHRFRAVDTLYVVRQDGAMLFTAAAFRLLVHKVSPIYWAIAIMAISLSSVTPGTRTVLLNLAVVTIAAMAGGYLSLKTIARRIS